MGVCSKNRGCYSIAERPDSFDTGLRVDDGELTYIDEDPTRPLRMTRVNLRAENIRYLVVPARHAVRLLAALRERVAQRPTRILSTSRDHDQDRAPTVVHGLTLLR